MITSDTLPPDIDALVRDELAPGERVAYAAQPLAGRAALRACLIWAFAVPWTAFSVFWTVMAAGAAGAVGGWGVLFPLWGTPFIAVGLAMLSAPAFTWRSARRTLYAVTDRRALVFEAEGFRGVTVRTYGPADVAHATRTEQPDGAGDLVFSHRTTRDSDGDATTVKRGFLNVPDVRAAEAAVRRLAAGRP